MVVEIQREGGACATIKGRAGIQSNGETYEESGRAGTSTPEGKGRHPGLEWLLSLRFFFESIADW